MLGLGLGLGVNFTPTHTQKPTTDGRTTTDDDHDGRYPRILIMDGWIPEETVRGVKFNQRLTPLRSAPLKHFGPELFAGKDPSEKV